MANKTRWRAGQQQRTTLRRALLALAATRLVLRARRRRQRRGGLSVAARLGMSLAAITSGGAVSLWLLRRLRALDLRGRVVLITGGSRGLGLALAEEFARHGARLVLCARNAAELEAGRARLAPLAADVLTLPCDITNREQVAWLIREATVRMGAVDVLVNNAGTIAVGPLESQTVGDFEEAMATMFRGPLYASLEVLPQMRARHAGHIVNITSIGGKVSVPHVLAYGAAKFAAVGLSQGMRAELAKDGVTVVTVVPGLMRTGSPLNARFTGRHRAEYTWFSLADSLPGLSIGARRAARKIVRATRHGKAEVIIGLPAAILVRAHGLFPGLVCNALGVVNRFLPAPEPGEMRRWSGRESENAVTRSLLAVLTRRAAQRLNQEPVSWVPLTQTSDTAGPIIQTTP